MASDETLKQIVREKYGEIARQSLEQNKASCCGSGGCSTEVYNIMTDQYNGIPGYEPDADLGLGCGLPVEFAHIKEGDTVVDLGSGAGNDCFVARHETGPTGKVIGVDFTPEMIEKARSNAEKLGLNNVEFRFGDIEKIPVTANAANVVISNCVLNLVPDKDTVMREIYRVLKPGGHFSISDIVLKGELPQEIKEAAVMYAGCVSGAVQKEEYLGKIQKQGFANLTLQKEKEIIIPDDILSRYLSPAALVAYRANPAGIFSITVYAEKPAEISCCSPSSTSKCC